MKWEFVVKRNLIETFCIVNINAFKFFNVPVEFNRNILYYK